MADPHLSFMPFLTPDVSNKDFLGTSSASAPKCPGLSAPHRNGLCDLPLGQV